MIQAVCWAGAAFSLLVTFNLLPRLSLFLCYLLYLSLLYAGNMSDPENGRFHQTIQERLTDIGAEIIFFTLEINRLEEKDLQSKLNAAALARYRPWFDAVRAFPELLVTAAQLGRSEGREG